MLHFQFCALQKIPWFSQFNKCISTTKSISSIINRVLCKCSRDHMSCVCPSLPRSHSYHSHHHTLQSLIHLQSPQSTSSTTTTIPRPFVQRLATSASASAATTNTLQWHNPRQGNSNNNGNIRHQQFSSRDMIKRVRSDLLVRIGLFSSMGSCFNKTLPKNSSSFCNLLSSH